MSSLTPKSPDELLYLYSVLKRLGCGDITTFKDRLKTQKIQYFAQLFGVSLNYRYNLYLYGPYSPELANDLYKIRDQKLKPQAIDFIPEELKIRFSDLAGFIKELDNNRKLEVTVTLHWLIEVAKLPLEKAQEELCKIKSATLEEFEYALSMIKKYERLKANYN